QLRTTVDHGAASGRSVGLTPIGTRRDVLYHHVHGDGAVLRSFRDHGRSVVRYRVAPRIATGTRRCVDQSVELAGGRPQPRVPRQPVRPGHVHLLTGPTGNHDTHPAQCAV